jgi:hypothetical protein
MSERASTRRAGRARFTWLPVRLLAAAGAAVATVMLIAGTSAPNAVALQKEASIGGRSWSQIASFVGVSSIRGLTCPASAACEAVGDFNSAGIALRSRNDGVTWSDQPLPTGIEELQVVACHSASVCVAGGEYGGNDGEYGDVALRTTNGGATWVAKKFPAGIGNLGAISCPTASVCEVLGASKSGGQAVASRTTDGGKTWVNRTVHGVSQALAISCPTPSTCEGVSENNHDYPTTMRSTNGGKTWSLKVLPVKEAQYLGTVVCQSAKVCQAGGTTEAGPAVLRTTNGGASWKPETLPTGLSDGYITSLSCPSASVCTAIDPNGFMRTTDSGAKWAQEALATGVTGVTVLSCPNRLACVAAGSNAQGQLALHTNNAGVKWVSDALPSGLSQLDAIACRSTKVCESGGLGGTARTTDGGASWAQQSVANYSDYGIDSIACSSVQVCEAGDGGASAVLYTVNGGSTWAASTTFPPSLGRNPFVGLACSSASSCLGVIENGAAGSDVLHTKDGGHIWLDVGSPAAARESLSGLSCPSAHVCEAVGEADSEDGGAAAIRTTDGGLKWVGGEKFPHNIAELTAVACPTSSTCEAVGMSYAVESGTTVRAVHEPVPCSASVCSATSGSVPAYPYALRTTNGGRTWTGTKLPSDVGTLGSIACPTPSVCEAVGAHATPTSAAGQASTPAVVAVRTTDGGATWAAQPLPAGITALKGVACPSPSDCYAVGYNPTGGLVVRFR